MTRRRIRDIRHDELIDATIRAVHAKGFAKVTMAEIAREAESTAPSISYYFGSKEKLMEATMRRLLSLLKTAMLKRYADAKTPRERLLAVLDANFDDALFTTEQCSLWLQFWASAPYVPALARLHRINRARVDSHFRAELTRMLPLEQAETVRVALQSYMDGVWAEAAQADTATDPKTARREAHRVATLLIEAAGG